MTDEAGTQVASVVRDSFGNVLEAAGEMPVPLGFAGGLADPDTGLVLFGARDYDPALGRWLAKDPIGFAGGDVNLYGYCLGDPVGLVDPSGLWTFGAGINVSRTWVVGGGDLSVQIVGDNRGNLGIMASPGAQEGLAVSTALAVQYSGTNARTIFDLRGRSDGAGGSGGMTLTGGFEQFGGKQRCGDGYEGWNVSLGVGRSVLPAEAHAMQSRSYVVGISLIQPMDTLVKNLGRGGFDMTSSETVGSVGLRPISADGLRCVER